MSPVTKERIDIEEPLRELCDRLGLEYECVQRMRFTPGMVDVEVYLRNPDGAKYVDPVTERPASETRWFEVRT